MQSLTWRSDRAPTHLHISPVSEVRGGVDSRSDCILKWAVFWTEFGLRQLNRSDECVAEHTLFSCRWWLVCLAACWAEEQIIRPHPPPRSGRLTDMLTDVSWIRTSVHTETSGFYLLLRFLIQCLQESLRAGGLKMKSFFYYYACQEKKSKCREWSRLFWSIKSSKRSCPSLQSHRSQMQWQKGCVCPRVVCM